MAEREGFSDAQQSIPHNPGHPQTELDYRLGWAYTRLKNITVLINPSRGIWELTERGRRLTEVQFAREKHKSNYMQRTR